MSNLELGFDLDALLNKSKKRSRYKFESLKEGSAIYRILPSFNPANRKLDETYNMHWLTGSSGNPMKVACTYYTEKYCPICEAWKAAKEAYESARKESPDGAHAKRLAEAEQRLRKSRYVYYNALNAANEPVILQLSSTVSGLLDKKIIEAVQEKSFDPTALKGGVWFKFSKQGKGRESVAVDFNRISATDADGEIVEKLDRRPVADDLASQLPGLVADLTNTEILWIKTFSSKELADYLRGVPLNDGRRSTTAQDASDEEEEEGENNTPSNSPYTPPSSAGASDKTFAAPTTGSPSAQDFAARAAYLRSLAENKS